MLEINDLYRVIGACLKEPNAPPAPSRAAAEPAPETGTLETGTTPLPGATGTPTPGSAPAEETPAPVPGAAPPPGWLTSRNLGVLGLALALLLAWIQVRRQRS